MNKKNYIAKLSTLYVVLFACLLSIGMVACDKDDDEKKVEDEQPTVIHEFKGYIYVTSQYFTDKFYGNDATLSVLRSNGVHSVKFTDPQWGVALFPDVQLGEVLNGKGTLTMVYRGQEGTYDATLSGPMMQPVITIPDVMGGTTIKFQPGTAPE